MASLTIVVGPVTATKAATDAAAQALFNDYIAAFGGPVNGTNQQKADYMIAQLTRHIREVANGYNVRSTKDAAEVTANQTVSTRDWT